MLLLPSPMSWFPATRLKIATATAPAAGTTEQQGYQKANTHFVIHLTRWLAIRSLE